MSETTDQKEYNPQDLLNSIVNVTDEEKQALNQKISVIREKYNLTNKRVGVGTWIKLLYQEDFMFDSIGQMGLFFFTVGEKSVHIKKL